MFFKQQNKTRFFKQNFTSGVNASNWKWCWWQFHGMTEQTDCLIVEGVKLEDKQWTVWSAPYNVHMNCCVDCWGLANSVFLLLFR